MIPAHKPDLSMRHIVAAFLRKNENSIEYFERELRRFLGVKFVILTASGKQALFDALRYGNVASKRVIMPAFTADIVKEVVTYAGGIPLYTDVSAQEYTLDPQLLPSSENVRALITVDAFGNPSHFDELQEFCVDHDILFIDDAATAFGSKYKKKNIGSLADVTIFSFGLGKSLAMGNMGCIATNNEELYEFLKSTIRETTSGTRDFLQVSTASILLQKELYSLVGKSIKQKRLKNQYSNLSAQLEAKRSMYASSLGRILLKNFKESLSQRRKLAYIMRSLLLEKGYSVQKENGMSTFNRLMFSTKKRENILNASRKWGIEMVSLSNGFPVKTGVCPVSDSLRKTLLGVPLDKRSIPFLESLSV